MEDLKIIQEFFSKPLKENTFKKGDKVTYLGNPAEITFVGKDQMDRVYYSVSYDKGNGKTKASNIYNKDGEIKPLKENAMAQFADYSNNELLGYIRELSKQRADAASKGQNDLVSSLNKDIEAANREFKKRAQKLKGLTRTDEGVSFEQIKKAVTHHEDGNPYYDKTKLINLFNQLSSSDQAKAKKEYSEYFGISKPVNEGSNEEDPIDIVTMDVPLFIRILEYSREDAQTDMDLHGLAEKAITGTKQQGILSMDDYDMLIDEQEQLTEASVPSNIKEFAKRKGVSSLVNKVAGWAERVGKKIVGGTAIGKNYDTLILDMGYQTSDIYIDCDEETIELYGKPINNFADFKRVFMEREQNLKEVTSKIVFKLKEEKPGLWANIRAKRERGEKPARKGSKAYKDAVKAGKKINKSMNESELEDLGDELAKAIKIKAEKDQKIKEALDPISVLSYVLAGNTLINILAKYAGKIFKKYNFGTGEKAAKNIYNFTHKLEDDFKSPIKTVIGLFTKDEKIKIIVTDALFILLLFVLGSLAGAEALAALKKSKISTAGVSALKAGLKGKDIMSVAKEIANLV